MLAPPAAGYDPRFDPLVNAQPGCGQPYPPTYLGGERRRGRVQIGSRSSITGADAENPKHLQRLVAALERKFPPLRGVEVEYSWWGWVDVSHDMMPRVCQPDPGQPVYYALGYGGNGVSYSAQAGRRMAQRIAGRAVPADLPIFAAPLPGHPFAPFRRLGQRLLYRWYYLRDEL